MRDRTASKRGKRVGQGPLPFALVPFLHRSVTLSPEEHVEHLDALHLLGAKYLRGLRQLFKLRYSRHWTYHLPCSAKEGYPSNGVRHPWRGRMRADQAIRVLEDKVPNPKDE